MPGAPWSPLCEADGGFSCLRRRGRYKRNRSKDVVPGTPAGFLFLLVRLYRETRKALAGTGTNHLANVLFHCLKSAGVERNSRTGPSTYRGLDRAEQERHASCQLADGTGSYSSGTIAAIPGARYWGREQAILAWEETRPGRRRWPTTARVPSFVYPGFEWTAKRPRPRTVC